MAHRWILVPVAGLAICVGAASMPGIARADDGPASATVSAARATPPAPPVATTNGCPYSSGRYGGHHCCCGGGGGLRYGLAAASAVTVGAAIALHVLAVNLEADLSRAYDARDPNHTAPRNSYADLMQTDAQRQAMQNWAIGLYVGGGVLTALTAFSFIAPAIWRRRAPSYVPAVAFGPASASLTIRF